MLAIICSFYLVIIFPHWYSIYTELCRGGDCKEVLHVSEVIQVLICSFRQRDGRRLLSPAALSFYQRPHASKFALIHAHVRVFVCVCALLEAVKLLIHSQQSQITVSCLIRKCGRHSVPLLAAVWPARTNPLFHKTTWLFSIRTLWYYMRRYDLLLLMH